MTPDFQASTSVYALGRVLEGGPVGGQVAPGKLTMGSMTAGPNVSAASLMHRAATDAPNCP
jgi:hypothetical protein